MTDEDASDAPIYAFVLVPVAIAAVIGIMLAFQHWNSPRRTAEIAELPVGDSIAVWNPCAAFPDESLVEVGLTPRTRIDRDFAGWIECTWSGTSFDVIVRATKHPFGQSAGIEPAVEVWRRNHYGDVGTTVVGTHTAIVAKDQTDFTASRCDVALPVAQGAIVFTLGIRFPNRADPCHEVVRVATALDPFLPPTA